MDTYTYTYTYTYKRICRIAYRRVDVMRYAFVCKQTTTLLMMMLAKLYLCKVAKRNSRHSLNLPGPVAARVTRLAVPLWLWQLLSSPD